MHVLIGVAIAVLLAELGALVFLLACVADDVRWAREIYQRRDGLQPPVPPEVAQAMELRGAHMPTQQSEDPFA